MWSELNNDEYLLLGCNFQEICLNIFKRNYEYIVYVYYHENNVSGSIITGENKIDNKKISDFSWGQQARLLLAAALIQNPDILLLDEPTNNLDKNNIILLNNNT